MRIRKKHELVLGHPISCWDDGEKYADRYTVVYFEDYDPRTGMVGARSMSANPFHPQGIGMYNYIPYYGVGYQGRGGVFKKRIPFSSLPEECQRCVKIDVRN